MTNTPYLEELILKSGKKKSFLATKCGVSRVTFYHKCQGKIQFTAPEIKILCTELGITSLKERELVFFT